MAGDFPVIVYLYLWKRLKNDNDGETNIQVTDCLDL